MLYQLIKKNSKRITFRHVKGHSKSAMNNMVDILAKDAIAKKQGIDSSERG
jgi:ribonuclease HI